AARGARTVTVGLGFAAFGLVLRRHRRLYGRYLALLGGGFAVGLGVIVHGWG
ncbi:1-acyl-sn-glycerol-3-phosphate acyltransferase, partial [Streptomyces sp. OfavH-34-F]|nr:1-acyl-sn-glycerol-3-phosphate acyltransferase [Streptomyces sp. OfavH-34-F]